MPWSRGTRLYWQTDFWPGRTLNVVGMSLDGQIDIHGFMIDLEVPWLFGAGTGPNSSLDMLGALGDVALGMHATLSPRADVTLHVGGSITLPTSFSPLSDQTGSIATAVWLMRDFVDLQRFALRAVGLRVPFGVEAIMGTWVFRSDLNALILMPVGSGTAVTGTTFVLEQMDEFEGRTEFGLCGGLRFQVAFVMYDRFGDFPTNVLNPIQAGLESFAGYESRGGFFARLGLFVALESVITVTNNPVTVRARIGYTF